MCPPLEEDIGANNSDSLRIDRTKFKHRENATCTLFFPPKNVAKNPDRASAPAPCRVCEGNEEWGEPVLGADGNTATIRIKIYATRPVAVPEEVEVIVEEEEEELQEVDVNALRDVCLCHRECDQVIYIQFPSTEYHRRAKNMHPISRYRIPSQGEKCPVLSNVLAHAVGPFLDRRVFATCCLAFSLD